MEIRNWYFPNIKSEMRKLSIQLWVTKSMKHLSNFIAKTLCLLTMYKHSLLVVIVRQCFRQWYRQALLSEQKTDPDQRDERIYLQMKVLLRKPLSGKPPHEDTSHPEILTGRQLATWLRGLDFRYVPEQKGEKLPFENNPDTNSILPSFKRRINESVWHFKLFYDLSQANTNQVLIFLRIIFVSFKTW